MVGVDFCPFTYDSSINFIAFFIGHGLTSKLVEKVIVPIGQGL